MCLVTPGTRDANNGNWRTAIRWAGLLRTRYRVIVQTAWDGDPADALIALHARRSAASIAAFRDREPSRPIAVVLTGTDLYRDLGRTPEAGESLDRADRVVVLQDDAQSLLEPRWRRKSAVIFQSAKPIAPQRRSRTRLECIVVGHLREEKDPATVFRAVERLPAALPIRVRHIGAALDERLGRAAGELQRRDSRYRYVGALAHGLTRIAMARSHLLVHPSIMEGGANVIVEAVTAGTPVLASRISGNIGMLGRDYPGYFPVGDADALAESLVRFAGDPRALGALAAACRKRKPLFRPEAEARALRILVTQLLAGARR